ncbi:MAG: hypothetical protein QUS35_10805 [bacterium]|nr:hypothetical protein [bacterium]
MNRSAVGWLASASGRFRVRTTGLCLCLILSVFGCRDSSPTRHDPGPDSNPGRAEFSLSVPYAEASEFKYIFPGFADSDTTGAPWGFSHQGLDLIPAGDSAAVIAPCGGVVEELKVYQNERNGQWQVNMTVRFDEAYVYHLLYEPRAHSEAEARVQRNAIPFSPGQRVDRGDDLGRLYNFSKGDMSGGDVTLHFDIWKNGRNICPEPYFTPEARGAMLALLTARFPAAQLCYP